MIDNVARKCRVAVAVFACAILSALPCSAEWKAMGEFEVSGYCGCPMCCAAQYGVTASGTRPRAGIVATDSKVIPMNSVIRIGSLRNDSLIVEDTGNEIVGKHIDLFFSNHYEAREWGRKTLKVWVWKP